MLARTFRSALVLLAMLALGCGPEDRDAASRPESPAGAPNGAGGAGTGSRTSASLSDIRDAEGEGRSYPVAPPPEQKTPVFGKTLPGSTERECVEVSRDGPIRSGEFVTEVFYLQQDEGTARWNAKMPWARLHLREEYFANEGEVREVRVRVAFFAEPSKVGVQRFSGTSGFEDLGEAYPSYVRLPGEGPWRLIATSGPDWGCFDLKPPGRTA